MYLTAETILPYLQQRAVVSARELAAGDWFALQAERRPVLRVSTVGGHGWIVKQASPLDSAHVQQLDREAALYQLAQSKGWARPLRKLLPRFRAYDPGVHALIIAELPHHSGWDYLRREGARPEVLGRVLGRAFATIHMPIPDSAPRSRLLPRTRPWILQLARTGIDTDDAQSPGRNVIDLIQQHPHFMDALAALAANWRSTTLIHGDAKLDNVIVRGGPRPQAWLIDWGLASHGDPAWDVGSMIQSCLVLWLNAMQFHKDAPFSGAVERASFPLALVRASVGAFVTAYVDARGLQGSRAQRFLQHAVRCSAARLAQSAFEHARTEKRFSPRHLAMLQISNQMFDDPDGAAREFGVADREQPTTTRQPVAHSHA